jgi:hypothetical protein
MMASAGVAIVGGDVTGSGRRVVLALMKFAEDG